MLCSWVAPPPPPHTFISLHRDTREWLFCVEDIVIMGLEKCFFDALRWKLSTGEVGVGFVCFFVSHTLRKIFL